MRLRDALSLPLFVKELVELASRRRTFVVRAVYAALLFLAFVFFYAVEIRDRGTWGGVWAILGSGGDLLYAIVGIQFAGVYLFLPPMVSDVVAGERERGTLALLLVTDMRPWEILLQKYLSRLLPMSTFLLLSLPLMAVAYSLGGVEADVLVTGVCTLALACLQIGAIALFFSVVLSSERAFLATYAALALLHLGLPIAAAAAWLEWMGWKGGEELVLTAAFGLAPPFVFANPWDKPLATQLLLGLPILGSAIAFLVLARVFVVRRAFAKEKDVALALARSLRRAFARMGRRRGRAGSQDDLPADAPVAWRETRRAALGSWRGFFVSFAVLGAAVAVLALAFVHPGDRFDAMSVVLTVLWIVCPIGMASAGASLVAGERAKGTLEALLVTPLTGGEILRQKMRAVLRRGLLMAAVMMTAGAFKAWSIEASALWAGNRDARTGTPWGLAYVLTLAATIAIYFPLFAYFGFWVASKAAKRAKAVVASTLALVAWCAGPPILISMALVFAGWHGGDDEMTFVFLASPATMVVLVESVFFAGYVDYAAPLVGANCVIYAAALGLLVARCHARAEAMLGRASPRRPSRFLPDGATEGEGA